MADRLEADTFADLLAAHPAVVDADAIPAEAAVSGQPEVEATLEPQHQTIPQCIAVLPYAHGWAIDAARDRGVPAHLDLVLRQVT
jgi:hypothetical protein